MDKQMERPFELLRRKSGEKYDDNVIRNFYIARHYGLKLLREITATEPFALGSDKSLHIVFEGTDARMLSVARQVALSAHFVNFKEEGADELPANRTVLTFITDDPNLKTLLASEEYLCNLPALCKFVNLDNSVENEDSYIDIEIHLSSSLPTFSSREVGRVISREDVDAFFDSVQDGAEEIFSIDTRKAYYTGEMYCIGEAIDNLPYEDIHDAKRYAMALNVYQYGKLKNPPKPMFEKSIGQGQQYKLKETISNVFCSDCFELRANAFPGDTGKKKGLSAWEKHNKELSESEHARWVVEKLIMGYRPLNEEERFHDERLRTHFQSKSKLGDFRKSLKRNDAILAHIDLCSYRDLRRIDPDNMKYDSFLMLGIPRILERVNNQK